MLVNTAPFTFSLQFRYWRGKENTLSSAEVGRSDLLKHEAACLRIYGKWVAFGWRSGQVSRLDGYAYMFRRQRTGKQLLYDRTSSRSTHISELEELDELDSLSHFGSWISHGGCVSDKLSSYTRNSQLILTKVRYLSLWCDIRLSITGWVFTA